MDNSRNIQQMFKVSLAERQEIQRIMIEENLSLSDVIRKAIRATYAVEGFESSYEKSANREVNIKKSKKWELY